MKTPSPLTGLSLVALLCLASSLVSAGEQDNAKVEGSLKDVRWGEHWAGPEIVASDLNGKVVILKIWGG